ncbi:MAG: DedA family protein [Syntrophales bacterium]|jgi:membrane-associated protein|nr:DedA family protein [Syntrophales bacterium]MDD5533771.1 DedA family protein [Syntrophales bacterium]HPL64577.1 DedA family protein [Syntrophales bacterium]
MDIILFFFDFLIHLDKHLDVIIRTYGTWTYAILIMIIFCETGFVVTPFLPGDSLLFAVGTFAALGSFQVEWIALALALAAISGDTTNYWIGRYVGPKVFYKEKSVFFNREYLDRTRAFYDRHGAKTVSIARFMPIVRTFAPFVAGIGRMPYPRFLFFSVAGTIAWISTFIFGGYFFGNIPIVKSNFTLVVMGIILISVLPGFAGYLKHRKGKK